MKRITSMEEKKYIYRVSRALTDAENEANEMWPKYILIDTNFVASVIIQTFAWNEANR
jgi:hypothetical protein